LTGALAVQVQSDQAETEKMAPADRRAGEIDDLLAAIAISFRESITCLEDTVAKITDLVIKQFGSDRDLVMALQNFDRLQQEFSTLGEVVALVSTARSRAPGADESGVDEFCHHVIESISIAELKERIAFHFKTVVEDPEFLEDSEDVEF
jgi:hypothetical protein